VSLTVVELAYAKVNLCLFLGPTRADGRHELVTVFDSVRLTDELIVAESESGIDEVVCDGVTGPNLVADALAGLRDAGWAAPPVRVEIWKRIPVAGGMGGGSADAAAILRCAPRMAPVDPEVSQRIAASLGADVPSQLVPGPSLGTGAGEMIEPIGSLGHYAVLVLPQPFALSTADVYREADRLGVGRSADELAALGERVRVALDGRDRVLPEELAVNDLQAASLSLRPELEEVLAAAREAGADRAMVCGSGPTVIGIFLGEGAGRRARAAAADEGLRARYPGVAGASPKHSAQSGLRL
jgi:4-diphosphocytidyl-2-C-methyl-D-erythritol kinase